MTTSFDILVIILSVTLFIFLVLSIIVLTMVRKLMASLQNIADKGEHLVDTAVEGAEEISETLRRNAGAVSLLKLIAGFVSKDKK